MFGFGMISSIFFWAATLFFVITALAGFMLVLSKADAARTDKCKYVVKTFTFNGILLFLLSWFLG